ncbi:MAG: hypothetical protein Q4C42_09025 [Clostridia bacterium]|nr:hypothetical protein [Clostridia bacterium]
MALFADSHFPIKPIRPGPYKHDREMLIYTNSNNHDGERGLSAYIFMQDINKL